MKIVDLSIRRPVTIFIFSVAAVVFGTVSYRNLAVNLLPDISYPSLTIRSTYEGTAPIEVESLLTRPIENAVGVVNNVVRVTSSSRADTSEVTLEFAWDTNMDFAALDVRDRLDRVRLPSDAELPLLLKYDPSLDPIMRIGLHGSGELTRMRFLAEEDVKRALERIEGVAAVVISGGLEEEIQVELDERKLAGLGLSVGQIVTRLAAENVNITGGTLRDGHTEYLVRTLNEFLRAEDMRKIVVLRTGDAIVRLSDVARVYTGHKEREIITRIDGSESVELAVYKEGGTNTVTVSDAVQAKLAEVRVDLVRVNPSLRLDIITDQARYIRQAVREVLETAFYGGLLAIMVLFLFLRSVKKTLIISVSIPVSVVATFFLMYVADISLNIMSLGGLTLGVGLLVDNAIVVLESVQRKRDEGLDEVEAARVGTSEVGRAITASTMTTICVFVPIVFVEGVAAQLFRDQALTVAFSLLVSLVVALTLIPMLASREFRFDETGSRTEDRSDSPTMAALHRHDCFCDHYDNLRAHRRHLPASGTCREHRLAAHTRSLRPGPDRSPRSSTRRPLPLVLRRPLRRRHRNHRTSDSQSRARPASRLRTHPRVDSGRVLRRSRAAAGHPARGHRPPIWLELTRAAESIEKLNTTYTIAGTSNEQGGDAPESFASTSDRSPSP